MASVSRDVNNIYSENIIIVINYQIIKYSRSK